MPVFDARMVGRVVKGIERCIPVSDCREKRMAGPLEGDKVAFQRGGRRNAHDDALLAGGRRRSPSCRAA